MLLFELKNRETSNGVPSPLGGSTGTRWKAACFDFLHTIFFHNKMRHLSSGTSTATLRMMAPIKQWKWPSIKLLFGPLSRHLGFKNFVECNSSSFFAFSRVSKNMIESCCSKRKKENDSFQAKLRKMRRGKLCFVPQRCLLQPLETLYLRRTPRV